MNTEIIAPAKFATGIAPGIASDLAKVAQEIRTLITRTTSDIISVGNKLRAVSERLEHGEFGKWIDAEFSMTQRTAQNYMRAAEWAADKHETISHLPPATVYLLAAPSTPAAASEDVINRLGRGERLVHAEINRLVRKAKDEAWLLAEQKKTADKEAKLSPRQRKTRAKRQEEDRLWEEEQERKRSDARAAAQELMGFLAERLGAEMGRFAKLHEAAGWAFREALKEHVTAA
jgi:hypothetical protein